MLKWNDISKDTKLSISMLLFNINWFFKYFLEEKVLPTNNQDYIDCFEEYFKVLMSACNAYHATDIDVVTLKSMIENLNKNESKTQKSKNIFSLLEEITHDLNVTYINMCIILEQKAFDFSPLQDLPDNEMIALINDVKVMLTPHADNMIKQREIFKKYLFEFIYLNEKLLTKQ